MEIKWNSVFHIQEALLERGHDHAFLYRQWLCLHNNGRAEWWWQSVWPTCLEYSLSGPFQKKSAHPFSGGSWVLSMFSVAKALDSHRGAGQQLENHLCLLLKSLCWGSAGVSGGNAQGTSEKRQKEAWAAAKRTTHHSRPQSGLPSSLPDSYRGQMLRILDFTAASGACEIPSGIRHASILQKSFWGKKKHKL